MSAATAAGPVLVHFFELAQLGSLRALPRIADWHERFADRGLTVLGVHSPRFAFTGDRELLASELARLGIRHPVADDSRHELWRDYDPGGWPALFLWDQGGALRWAHFGEGAYTETEAEIEAALAGEPVAIASVAAETPETNGASTAGLVPPSPEIFPGGSPSVPTSDVVEVAYEAGGVHAVLDGGGRFGFSIDAGPVSDREVERAGLYELADHDQHGHHTLLIEPRDGARLWAIGFSAGTGPGGTEP
ncbi:hypothetical protein HJD18_05045 [Thermoleophilia bacterium SCSIO 60948]|nr:hypothetical protein HJD18_05045 [Thermoleophilia bacterium SCSIO 60948]